MIKMKKKKMRGFTLIELVIVIAIIALLLAIAIPKFQQSNLSAQAAAHNANVRVIKNAAILYLADHPEATSIDKSMIVDYIEGKEFPKPAKDLGINEFNITLQNGEVHITPGTVSVVDKQLRIDN